MKTPYKPIVLCLPLLALLAAFPFQTTLARQEASPTPTYDPFAEPPLPPNPTQYEIGRNLYWHWCMTCHGDQGQGLTDEFRGLWEPDHQNCWGRGCHSGRRGEPGFPIPTVVPAVVNENHLVRFGSQQQLADFLAATHPPQSPGILKREEYQAIALFVFTMNGRLPHNVPITAAPVPAATGTVSPAEETAAGPLPAAALLLVVVVSTAVVLLRRRAHSRE